MSASPPVAPDRPARAFTLMELLAVIGLIAVLAGLVIGSGVRASNAGKAARARAELTTLMAALDAYRQAHGDYPRTDDPARLLQSLIGTRGPDNQPLSGRVLLDVAHFRTLANADPFTDATAVLLDPWERPYGYAYKTQLPWTNPTCVLWSAGPDGAATTTMLAGGFADRSATDNADNADNLYADQP